MASKFVSLRITRRSKALTFANHGPVDRVSDWTALHRDDRLVTISTVRRRGQARDVSGWEGREHAFGLNGRDVVALVDHNVAVGADEVMEVIAARECLDHRDVDLPRQAAPAGAEPADRPRRDVEELAEPFAPLLDQRFAVNEHER